MSDEVSADAREKIERAYANAIGSQVEDPIVLVLDLHDEHALWMTERIVERSKIDQAILDADKQGVTPLMVCAVPRKQAGQLMSQQNPNFGGTLEKIQVPSPQFLVVRMTGGRSIFFGFPPAS